MPKKSGIDKTLYCVADLKSSLRIEIKPRVRPHPGHENPNKFFIMHNGKETNFVIIQRRQKRANPTNNECRACFFLFDAFLYLCQRLTITVAETAGDYRNQI